MTKTPMKPAKTASTRNGSLWLPPKNSIQMPIKSGAVYVLLTAVGSGNIDNAKKLSHMAEITNKLRRMCRLQLNGNKINFFSLVHAKRINTESKPRKNIIGAKLASKSAE